MVHLGGKGQGGEVAFHMRPPGDLHHRGGAFLSLLSSLLSATAVTAQGIRY